MKGFSITHKDGDYMEESQLVEELYLHNEAALKETERKYEMLPFC